MALSRSLSLYCLALLLATVGLFLTLVLPRRGHFRKENNLRLGDSDLSAVNSNIEPGTFVYLGMGPEEPSDHMAKRACLPSSMLLYLSFKVRLKEYATPSATCRFKPVFGPGTTWTSGRNRLLAEARRVEMEQGWRFEYIIFMDNDVQLVLNNQTERAKVYRGDTVPELQLQHLLLRDRPLRASVKYGSVPAIPYANTTEPCIVVCFNDVVVDAYHRTAVDMVLPYDERLEYLSWWMSAYFLSIKFAAVLPQYCTMYTQLAVNVQVAQHSNYPVKIYDDPIWANARAIIRYELASRNVPGFPWGMTDEEFNIFINPHLFGVEGKAKQCISNPFGVDYNKTAHTSIFKRI